MPYPTKALRKHPGANPHRKSGGSARWFWLDRKKSRVSLVDQSRWIPHQGKREIARRLKNKERHHGS